MAYLCCCLTILWICHTKIATRVIGIDVFLARVFKFNIFLKQKYIFHIYQFKIFLSTIVFEKGEGRVRWCWCEPLVDVSCGGNGLTLIGVHGDCIVLLR